MKVLKVLGILLVVIVVLGLIASLVLPKKMSIKSEQTIDAPMAVVWNNIKSLQKCDKWSPWYDDDENMKVTFDGEEGAIGSSFSWSGEKVGEGTQTITAIDAENHKTESEVKHDWGGGTNVTWLEDAGDGKTKIITTYEEEMGIPGNIFGAIMGAEAMMEKKFAKGLSNLKELAEGQAKEVAAMEAKPDYDISVVDREVSYFIGKKVTMDIAKIDSAYFAETYGALMPLVGEAMAGPPSALYWDWDTVNNKSVLTAAIPVKEGTKAPAGFEIYTQPAGQYTLMRYRGGYDEMGAAHGAMDQYIRENGLKYNENGAVMEEYVEDPQSAADPEHVLIHIIYPVTSQEAAEATGGENEGEG